MEYIAESKNIKISPRKVRLVVEGIKQFELPKALNNLDLLHHRAAIPVKKTLESAIANAVHNFKADKNGLVIKEILVNEGIMYKRYHYAARGRVRPYKKRTSHIRVVLQDNLVIDKKDGTQQPVEEKVAPPTIEEKKVEKKSVLSRFTRGSKKSSEVKEKKGKEKGK